MYIFSLEIHTIAAIKSEESYEKLAMGFRDVFEDVNKLILNPRITILEKQYELVFYISSDYKLSTYATCIVNDIIATVCTYIARMHN